MVPDSVGIATDLQTGAPANVARSESSPTPNPTAILSLITHEVHLDSVHIGSRANPDGQKKGREINPCPELNHRKQQPN